MGDHQLLRSYVAAVGNNDPRHILSGPEETLESHRMVFAAERAARRGRSRALRSGGWRSLAALPGLPPQIQILTFEGWLAGSERLEAPPQANPFAKAEREVKAGKQEEML